MDQLAESLDFAEPGEWQRPWFAEALRWREEVRSGLFEAIPGEQGLAEVRRTVWR